MSYKEQLSRMAPAMGGRKKLVGLALATSLAATSGCGYAEDLAEGPEGTHFEVGVDCAGGPSDFPRVLLVERVAASVVGIVGCLNEDVEPSPVVGVGLDTDREGATGILGIAVGPGPEPSLQSPFRISDDLKPEVAEKIENSDINRDFSGVPVGFVPVFAPDNHVMMGFEEPVAASTPASPLPSS